MRNALRLGIAALSALLVTAPASAFEFVVENDGDAVVFDPFSSAQSGASYYSYFNASGHPAFGTQEDTAFFWLHENSTNGDLSLSMIFDAPTSSSDPDYRTLVGDLDMNITGLPNGSYVSKSDDGVELRMTGSTTAVGTWAWLECCTDGGVISGINDDSEWEIDLDITNIMGLNDFYFLAGDYNNPTTVMSLNAGETITVSMREASSSVPTPLPVLLLGGGLLVIAARRRALRVS